MSKPAKLIDVPAFLCRIRPGRDAPAEDWAVFYERSAVVYSQVAETDRASQREALIIASLDREKSADYRKRTEAPQ